MVFPINNPPRSLRADNAGEAAFRILQLWYREAYEETAKRLRVEEERSKFWQTRYNGMAKSRDYLRQSNRVMQRRITAMEEYIESKHRLIDQIFSAFPEVRDAYELGHAFAPLSEEETDEEDLTDSVRRRLHYD